MAPPSHISGLVSIPTTGTADFRFPNHAFNRPPFTDSSRWILLSSDLISMFVRRMVLILSAGIHSFSARRAATRSRRLPILAPHCCIVASALLTRCCTFAQVASCLSLAMPIFVNFPVIRSLSESVYSRMFAIRKIIRIFGAYGYADNNMVRRHGFLLPVRSYAATCSQVARGCDVYHLITCDAFYCSLS